MADTSITSTEPVALEGSIRALITGVIGLALAFGWVDWTEEQIGAILIAYTAVFGVVTPFVRNRVTPV